MDEKYKLNGINERCGEEFLGKKDDIIRLGEVENRKWEVDLINRIKINDN